MHETMKYFLFTENVLSDRLRWLAKAPKVRSARRWVPTDRSTDRLLQYEGVGPPCRLKLRAHGVGPGEGLDGQEEEQGRAQVSTFVH
eukprot:COSAG05_NODE_372_length_10695_cov_5.301623_13_plen_87_part_00